MRKTSHSATRPFSIYFLILFCYMRVQPLTNEGRTAALLYISDKYISTVCRLLLHCIKPHSV